MTRHLIACLALLAGTLGAQPYVNGPFITHAAGFPCTGTIAPGAASALDTTALPAGPAFGTFGYTALIGSFRLADDFVVPPGQKWSISSIKVYGYQTISSDLTTSTFTAGNYRIWCGRPGAGGTILHDYSTANQMTSTSWTGVYRQTLAIINGTPCTTANTSRKIMEINMMGNGIVLGPGTYYLDFALSGSVASGPFVPPVTVFGPPGYTPATGNARQQAVATGLWVDIGNGPVPLPQDVPFEIAYTMSTAGPGPEWQSNSPAASLDFNGVQSTGCSPAITNVCVGQTVTATFKSTSSLPWELAYSLVPNVPLSGGGISTANCQTVNINLLDPSTSFLFGLAFTTPFPVPFGASSPATLVFAAPPITLSAQFVVLDPGNPDGIALSQAASLVGSLPTPPSFPIAGPALDESFVTIDLNALPNCQGMDYFGTTYSRFHVMSNGYVSFDTIGLNDFTPTVNESLVRKIVGAWHDLNPASAGSGGINITSPSAGVLSVNFNGVYRFSTPSATNAATFQIVLDTNTGDISLNGLSSGIPTNPTAAPLWLGISSGYPGTGTGGALSQPVIWAPGTGVAAANTSTHQFAATTFVPGVLSITFSRSGSGGYNFTAL